MGLYLLLFIASLPIILMCMYIYKKDYDKEPSYLLKKLFIYGALSIVPIIILELLTSKISVLDTKNFLSLFINVFICVGLIEEGAKWVIVNKSVYNDIEFNHAYDAIVYCVFASLGFALIENILYVYQEGITIGLLRAITTIPAHTFNGVLMGYFLGLSKSDDINKKYNDSKHNMFLSLFIPVLTHTIYDYLIFLEDLRAVILFFIFVIIMYIIIFKIVKNISLIKNNFDGSSVESKDKVFYEHNSKLFTYALSSMFIVAMCLIELSGLSLVIDF